MILNVERVTAVLDAFTGKPTIFSEDAVGLSGLPREEALRVIDALAEQGYVRSWWHNLSTAPKRAHSVTDYGRAYLDLLKGEANPARLINNHKLPKSADIREGNRCAGHFVTVYERSYAAEDDIPRLPLTHEAIIEVHYYDSPDGEGLIDALTQSLTGKFCDCKEACPCRFFKTVMVECLFDNVYRASLQSIVTPIDTIVTEC